VAAADVRGEADGLRPHQRPEQEGPTSSGGR
jgi:hypothetical protein